MQLEGFAAALGLSGIAGALFIALLWVVRGAIIAAVEQAGKAELARLTASLADDLQKKRDEFQQILETTRQNANIALESFRADLQLPAEVRRQVAVKKVEALIAIATLGERLMRDVVNVNHQSQGDRARAREKVRQYVESVRQNSFLFEEHITQSFQSHVTSLTRAAEELHTNPDSNALATAIEDTNAFLRLVRSELGISGRIVP